MLFGKPNYRVTSSSRRPSSFDYPKPPLQLPRETDPETKIADARASGWISPSLNAATRGACGPGEEILRKPITGFVICCARAASGQAAAPPTRPKNDCVAKCPPGARRRILRLKAKPRKYLTNRLMSESGQTRKWPDSEPHVCSTPKSRNRPATPACPFRANGLNPCRAYSLACSFLNG
jgi:hypothetical protein